MIKASRPPRARLQAGPTKQEQNKSAPVNQRPGRIVCASVRGPPKHSEWRMGWCWKSQSQESRIVAKKSHVVAYAPLHLA